MTCRFADRTARVRPVVILVDTASNKSLYQGGISLSPGAWLSSTSGVPSMSRSPVALRRLVDLDITRSSRGQDGCPQAARASVPAPPAPRRIAGWWRPDSNWWTRPSTPLPTPRWTSCAGSSATTPSGASSARSSSM